MSAGKVDVLAVMDDAHRVIAADIEYGEHSLDYYQLAARIPEARATVAELLAHQQEWVCTTCRTVLADRLGLGPMGMGCACGGVLRPSSQTERLLEERLAAAETALTAALARITGEGA